MTFSRRDRHDAICMHILSFTSSRRQVDSTTGHLTDNEVKSPNSWQLKSGAVTGKIFGGWPSPSLSSPPGAHPFHWIPSTSPAINISRPISSPSHSFLPGLKRSFFCKSFPPQHSFSSSELTTRFPGTVYRYFWAYPFFLLFSFSSVFHFSVVGSVR